MEYWDNIDVWNNLEYFHLKSRFACIAEDIIQKKSTNFHPMIKELTYYLTKDLNVSLKEQKELCEFLEDLFLDFTLTAFNVRIDLFIDHCKYKMKSSNVPSVKKISKQLEIKDKLNQIDSDFN